MINCPNCGLKQEKSNFCGVCGTPLHDVDSSTTVPVEPASVSTHAQQTQTTSTQPDAVKEYKEKLQNYWTYFKACLKTPSQNADSNQFKFAMISNILSVVLLVIVSMMLVNAILSFSWGNYSSLVFNSTWDVANYLGFGVFIRFSLIMALFYALLIILVAFLAKSFGHTKTWQDSFLQLSAYNSYIILGLVICAGLLMLNLITIPTFLLSTLFAFFIFYIPLYVVVRNFKNTHNLDPFLRYVITIGALLLYYVIIISLFLENVTDFLDFFTNI